MTFLYTLHVLYKNGTAGVQQSHIYHQLMVQAFDFPHGAVLMLKFISKIASDKI